MTLVSISPYTCEMCKTRLVTLEKAVLDLASFRDLACNNKQSELHMFGVHPGSVQGYVDKRGERNRVEIVCLLSGCCHSTHITTLGWVRSSFSTLRIKMFQ